MKIKEVTLYVIAIPLKTPFVTHLSTVVERQGIIVEVIDSDGVKGYGEAVAFPSPWYTEETVQTCLHMLSDFLIPILQKATIKHPSEAYDLFKGIRRNRMAKASLEMAIWDLYAKRNDQSLSSILGGTKTQIPAGAVVAAQTISEVISQIEAFLEIGYQRIKIKINPANDHQIVSEVRKRFPDVALMVDANSAYTLHDIDRLKVLDEFQLLMIEQPLADDDIYDHAIVQKQINTPICLDESIHSLEDAKRAIELQSCQIINIKIGRVGGLQKAKEIYDICLENDIRVWVGGMLEFGVSRAHNIAFSSLPGFQIPGDISATSRYWEHDIVDPEVEVKNGFIQVPTQAGIGFEVNKTRLKEVLIEKRSFPF